MKKKIKINTYTRTKQMCGLCLFIYTIKKIINVVAANPTRSRNIINFDKPRLKQNTLKLIVWLRCRLAIYIIIIYISIRDHYTCVFNFGLTVSFVFVFVLRSNFILKFFFLTIIQFSFDLVNYK